MSGKNELTPMMRQYHEIKSRHKDAILMFRLGDFYEMFLDDAKTASRELDLTLTSKPAGKNNRIPLAGIPYHAVNNYIGRLIRKGYKVAICEQMEDPKKTKSLVKREVIRIITPGTALDNGVLDDRDNNYLLCLHFPGTKNNNKRIGIAASDLSTGEFIAAEVSDEDDVLNEFARFQPRECLVSSELLDQNPPIIKHLQDDYQVMLTPVESWRFDMHSAKQELCEQFKLNTLEGFGIYGSESFIPAAGVILYYLKKTQKTLIDHFNSLIPYNIGEGMVLDRITVHHLELVKSIRGQDKEGTLLAILDKTATSMGARLLKKRLLEPLTNPERINERLEYVDCFYKNLSQRNFLRDYFKEIQDIERLTARISCGTGNARELLALSTSLKQIPDIKKTLEEFNHRAMSRLNEHLETLDDIVELIDKTITDSPPLTIKDGGLIREGTSQELDSIKNGIKDSREWIANLQPCERERTGISSLKVGFNSVFGYYIEVTKSNLKQVPENYIRKQTLTNAERFITPELKEVEALVLGAQDKINQLEFEIFCGLRDKISQQSSRLIDTAHILAQIDVDLTLAIIAVENGFARPEITDKKIIEIRNGRHPVVEKHLRREPFIPNDLEMNDSSALHLITGPNMAGKSTYIRQVALMILMAQSGSFVPADKMVFRPVDRIFTRVGASDDISRGHSTFMVEMLETANILNHATPDSLIILDEIGRGTSTFDGMSIAWAVAEYIVSHFKPVPFTLFATHYHELTALEDVFAAIVNFNITIKEYRDKIIFLRKIQPGRADKSYGIQVGRLAGLPEEVIERARDILTKLEGDESIKKAIPSDNNNQQLPLFTREKHPVIKKIEKINPDDLTPLEALNLISELKKEL